MFCWLACLMAGCWQKRCISSLAGVYSFSFLSPRGDGMRHSEEDCQVISHCLARGYYLDALNYSSATGALAAILHLLWAAAWATRKWTRSEWVRELGPVNVCVHHTPLMLLVWDSFDFHSAAESWVMYVHRARHIELIKVYENSKRIISKTMWVPIKLFFSPQRVSLSLYLITFVCCAGENTPIKWHSYSLVAQLVFIVW